MQDPVFILGALRSGTTVFRLMLDAHPGLANPGEADFLFDHLTPRPDGGWRADRTALARDRIFQAKSLRLPETEDGTTLVRDLLDQFAAAAPGRILTLNLHRHAGLLASLRPQARVIHMLRDPRDVARSSIGMGWAGHVYFGVDHWLDTETDWDRAAPRLAPGNLLDLRYEDLIARPEAELTRVCGFLGVGFDPAMLAYDGRSTYAAPDLSLIAQWRHKLSPRDIGLLEGKAGALMQARGYPPSGHPVRHPGPLARAALGLANKGQVWARAIATYGLRNVVMEKLTRRLGWTSAHAIWRARIDAIMVTRLK